MSMEIKSRSLIVFGNGMGMALDEKYFSLQAGLKSVWNDSDHLSEDHKNLILSAIKGTTQADPPSSEDQLDQLQVAIVATEFLRKFEVNGTSWVSGHAKDLPSTFKKYIHEVALYFHRSEQNLPDKFLKPLSEYIQNTRPHVVTLNYDNLLYDGLISTKVLKGFSGPLIDGYTNKTGFDEGNLNRKNINKHGWYMHLHGSPLFIGNKKMTGIDRDFLDAKKDSHIVLTHVAHKPIVIGSSPILSSYWRRLEKAFEESNRIVLFGYSGLDTHLNERIKLRNDKEILIVEWSGEGDKVNRETYWKDKIGFSKSKLLQIKNILTFVDWDC